MRKRQPSLTHHNKLKKLDTEQTWELLKKAKVITKTGQLSRSYR